MPDLDRPKEYQSWRRWKFITLLGSILKIGTVLRTDSGKGYSLPDEPPMVGLDKLIQDGLPEVTEAKPFTTELLILSMTAFASIKSESDDDFEAGIDIIRNFVTHSFEQDVDKSDLDQLLSKYREGIVAEFQVKNDLYALKQKLDKSQVQVLVDNLYRFVSNYELDSAECKMVFVVAEKLGMSHTDIRRTATRVQKENK